LQHELIYSKCIVNDKKGRREREEKEIQLTGNLGLWINSALQRHKDSFHKKNFSFTGSIRRTQTPSQNVK
jgi:hypothetical protein